MSGVEIGSNTTLTFIRIHNSRFTIARFAVMPRMLTSSRVWRDNQSCTITPARGKQSATAVDRAARVRQHA
jgi:hypothetical protein